MFFKRKKFTIQVPIIIKKDEDSYYAYCPLLKGLHTCGETEEEAIQNARNAVLAYIKSLIKHNEPIPTCVFTDEKELFDGHDRNHAKIENILVPA